MRLPWPVRRRGATRRRDAEARCEGARIGGGAATLPSGMHGGWRRRVARAVGVGGVAFLVAHFASSWPREVELRLQFGADHGRVREARLAVRDRQDGGELWGARLHVGGGMPPVLAHTLELPPGDYDLVVELSGTGGLRRRHVQRLQVPIEGVVPVFLGSGGGR